MNWLSNLFFGTGIAHSVATFALVIFVGVALGKIKIGGVSLGVTMALFVGIVASHFNMRIEPGVLHFVKEFGLILFVYAIGLQVGPSFFSSFKKDGLKMNMLSVFLVLAGVLICVLLHFVTKVPMPTMVGILSGAVTNTPGLGAATQAYIDATDIQEPSISLGYAVAYPLGVLGTIGTLIAIKYIFKINVEKEAASVAKKDDRDSVDAKRVSLVVKNPSIVDKPITVLRRLIGKNFVISRICGEDGNIIVPAPDFKLKLGDKILVITASKDIDAVTAFIGDKIDMSWDRLKAYMAARRIMVTNPSVVGKKLGRLGLYDGLGFNVTRVNRAGIDLVADPHLVLQIGDRVTIVGSESAINNIEKLLGNSMTNLRHPNIIPIFLGIFFGVLVGSIPFALPGLSQSMKLGLAGGPLIVAILISRFGYKFKIASYTTVSANLMLRELGIALFLAGVGLGAGEGFVDTLVKDGGYMWVLYGAIMTIVPVFATCFIARVIFRFDYFTIMGIISGSTTNPPALAYSNAASPNDLPAVGYSTVYPLTMFLRVLTAQLLIIFFV